MSKTIPQIGNLKQLPTATALLEVGDEANPSSTTSLASFGQKVPTIADLATLPCSGVANGLLVYVMAFSTAQDGGAGQFRYNSAGAATPVTGMIVNATGGGQWERVYSGSVNIRWSGATGNGSTDDSLAIQTMLSNYDVVYIPSGTYIAKNLTLRSNCVIFGNGQSSVIKAPATIGIGETILTNSVRGSYTNTNLTVSGIVFDGNDAGSGGSQTRFTELVGFARVTGLVIDNCEFRNVQFIGLAIGGCRYAKVINSRFTDCGFQGTSANCGPALYLGNTSTDITSDVVVSDCRFWDNFWHGITVSATRSLISQCVIKNCQEAGIFAGHSPGIGIYNYQCVIDNVTVEGITEHDISGSGIELGGVGLSVTNCAISNCEHNGIVFTDAQNVTVDNNVIKNVNTLTTPQGACIALVTTLSSPDQPKNIIISNNVCFDTQVSPTSWAAITVAGGAGSACESVLIHGNSVAGTVWAGGTAIVRNSKFGTGCDSRNNPGDFDIRHLDGSAWTTSGFTPITLYRGSSGMRWDKGGGTYALGLCASGDIFRFLFSTAENSSAAALLGLYVGNGQSVFNGWVKFGTTADSAATAGAGAVRWNSGTTKLQVSDGSSWIDLH